jgi:hypothetical protein
MWGNFTITGFTRSEGFESDAKSLDANTGAALRRDALTLLLTNPRAKRLCLHAFKGFVWPIRGTVRPAFGF